jgi:hypothetical protein
MSESSPRTSQLPAEPNLRHLKDQAKDLLRTGSAPSLAAALFEIAKLYGFSSWPQLKKHVVDQTIAGKLKQAIDRDDLDESVLFCPGIENSGLPRLGTAEMDRSPGPPNAAE